MDREAGRRVVRVLVVVSSCVLLAAGTAVQVEARQGGAARPAAYDTAFFGGLSWRNVGPVRGGRSIAVAGTNARPLEYWFGAVGGGVWKTSDAGNTWRPVSDGFFTSSSVGAIGQCEASPDIVYVGMGEVALRGNIMQGDGMYRTPDGGTTWQKIGLEATQAIGRVRVHPTNCAVLYVAALGNPYGPSPERGVYRSRDGGGSWQRVLFRDEHSGAVDLVIDPTNPDVLYAGFWQVQRTPWSLESGGPGGGLFKSTDGGETWSELSRNPGLPAPIWGKIGISVSGADGNRVYAIIEAEDGGVFRSDDAGRTWEKVNDERKLRQRAFYYTRIVADPVDRDVVYALNVGFFKSTDGGRTFPTQIQTPHADQHDFWIASNDNRRMVQGNDGGANVSFNGGATWTAQAYPTAQLYGIATTKHMPYWVCGAQQDNSTACMRSRGWPQMAPHVAVGGGESGYIASDPTDPDIIYSGSYGGLLTRFDYRTGQSQVINIWPDNPMGHSASEIRERFQWTFPIVFARTGPNRLYVGSQHLWMTTNGGLSWDRLSPDLTRADPKTMGPSGGPITRDQTGVETYATIFTIAPSPHDANTIWTGSDDGVVQITRDHGRTWTDVTPRGMPEFMRVSMLEASPHRPGTAYLAGKRYQLADRTPYIYRTDDYGRSWTRINAGIPDGHYVHVVREDIKRPGLLYAGTEHGVHISFDDGASWHPLQRNLPRSTQVPGLIVEENDLVIATHGRSAYVMDNISTLRQLTPQVAARAVHLFEPSPAYRDLDNAVAVSYFLRDAAQNVMVEVLDAAGTTVRSFASAAPGVGAAAGAGGPRPSTRPGVNRFSWDMRHDGAVTFPGMIMWAAGTNGPLVLPGRYQVRLTVDGNTQTQPFEIRLDPRAPHVTMADLQAQHALATQVRDRTSQANEGVIVIREVKRQAAERVASDASLRASAEALAAALSAVEEELYQVRNQSNQDPLNYPIRLNNKIAALMRTVEGVEGRPTAQAYTVFEELSGRLDEQLGILERVLIQDLARFNEQLRSRNLPPVTRPARTAT
jgi:photosystem II stability/assembly factor-like uncharacterized protein